MGCAPRQILLQMRRDTCAYRTVAILLSSSSHNFVIIRIISLDEPGAAANDTTRDINNKHQSISLSRGRQRIRGTATAQKLLYSANRDHRFKLRAKRVQNSIASAQQQLLKVSKAASNLLVDCTLLSSLLLLLLLLPSRWKAKPQTAAWYLHGT